MRTPNKRELDKIVRNIVEEVQSDPAGWDSTEVDVRGTIRYLRELDREIAFRGASKERIPARGKRQENAEDFTALLTQIKSLQKALKRTSGPALCLLFSGEEDVTSDKIPSIDVQQKIERRVRQVVATLAYMRARCNYLLVERPGEHGSADFRQRRVAHEAWCLMRRYGKKPASGRATSLYGRIAALLYEATTGEYGKDLERSCRATLSLAKVGGLPDDGIRIGSVCIPLQ